MKRLLLWCLIVAVVSVAALFCVGTFAMADSVPQQVLTQRYYELGDIYAISAYGGSVAVLRAKDDVAYLTVMGDVQAEVVLTVDASTLGEMQMAYHDGRVLLTMGDSLSVYDLAAGTWRRTNIPTMYESIGMMGTTYLPLTHFAVDERGTVYVCYQLIMGWLPIEDVFKEGDIWQNSTTLSQATQTYTSFSAHDGVCYFYRTSDSEGAYFSVDTNGQDISASESRVVLPLQTIDYAGELLCLRAGEVQSMHDADATTVIAQSSASDSGLVNATALCTSYDGQMWRVWVADNGQSAIKVYDGECRYLGMYGSWGHADGRLCDPTDVSHADMTVINDAGNHRLVVLDHDTYYHIDGDFACVATAGRRAYVGCGDRVYCYDFRFPQGDLPYTTTTYYLRDDVLSVCSDGTTVYALLADNLYILRTDETVSEQMPIAHAVRAKSGRHAGMIYVQTTDAICVFKDAVAVDVRLDIAALEVADFDVDYCGNIYLLLSDGSLWCYLRTASGYAQPTMVDTPSLDALSIGADGSLYALRRSALVQVALSVRTADNATYEAPQWDDPVSVVTVPQSVWGYASPDNYESIVRVPAGTYAMLMATHTYDGQAYYYVEFALTAADTVRYERVYIPTSAARSVTYTEPTDTYVRYDGASDTTGVYPYPAYSATALYMVPKADATFRVLRVMGVSDGAIVWPWYMVETSTGVGYVAVDNYVSAEPPYQEVERYYARCVANKLGEKVCVYAEPSDQSEVVATLVDGTKVELVSPYDANSQYTCIRMDDREVYILTANVTDRALTNGQTFALVMSIVVICAAVVTAILYALVRKRHYS